MLTQILVSLALGGALYLLTNVITVPQAQLWNVTVSIFLGGAFFVAQLLYTFESRLDRVESTLEQRLDKLERTFELRLDKVDEAQRRHSQTTESLVRAGFSKINEATELFGLVEASALRTDAVIQLVRHSTQIDPTSAPLVLKFAQAEISRTSEFLKELGDGGNIIYEGEDRDWMLALARNAETNIDATSLTTVDTTGRGLVDAGLWTSDLGQRYLEVQRDVIQQGVRVRRVFITDRADLANDPELVATCQLQQEMGVEVRVLNSSAIPGMRRTSMFDFVLFDDVISYEVTPAIKLDDSIRPTIVNTRLELRPMRVKDRIQRFKDLWDSAREP